jgi:polysaccharide export outer membrane protein
MKKSIFFQAGVLILLLSSCSSYKDVPYFQDLNRSASTRENIKNYSPLIIQPEDVLNIKVSSLNPGAWQDSTGKDEYLVSNEGTIQLPFLGEVPVAGSTASTLQEKLKGDLGRYLRKPTVNVRITNFKVSVFGDVAKPDVFKVPNSRITILEALSMAGDLNITGLRTNVLLIREVNGKREYSTIDLTKANLFQSDSYYLKNNDVIYVQPDRTKFATVDRGYRTLSLILSGLSIVAIVLANALN